MSDKIPPQSSTSAPETQPAVELPRVSEPAPAIDLPNKRERNDLREHRKFFIELDARASDSLDQAILNLSGGALAISVSLPPRISPADLIWAQGLFALALVFQTIALRAGRTATLDRALRRIDDRLEGKTPSISRERRRDVTYHLKNSALTCFVFGVVALLMFIRNASNRKVSHVR